MTIQLQGAGPGAQYEASNTGTRYTADANGYVYAAPNDVLALLAAGCTLFIGSLGTNFRNLLDGGDFTVNPWQRNIAPLASGGVISTAINTTPTYFADRWFAYSNSGSAAVLMANVADTSVPGFGNDCKVQRQSGNAITSTIYFGQVIETADSIRAQGQTVTLSFWAKAGANFSAANSTLNVQLVSGTGTNQSAANLVASAWTGQATPISSSQALTTSMVRYSFTGTVAAGATQLAALFNFVPVGTAGSDDSFYINGIQLEVGANAGAFEHRDVQVELEICQRYAWMIPEPASTVVTGAGMNTGSAAQTFYLAAPVQFYKAPTVTTALGTFKTNQAGTATAITTLAANSTHTVNAIGVTANSTGTAGQATLLQGGGGTGYILASADF